MRFRLRKYLPRYPYVFLIPAILALWFVLSTARPGNRIGIRLSWHPQFGQVAEDGYGFPFVFIGAKLFEGTDPPAYCYYGFNLYCFLADLALALAAAYVVAMGVGRLMLLLTLTTPRGERAARLRAKRMFSSERQSSKST